MVLLHGGGPGAEKIAARWAEKHGVHQVVCKPDWNRDGKAAPFRRNDVLLNLLPKGLVAFPGSGITDNMIDKARRIGIPVLSRRRVGGSLPGRSPPPHGAGPVPFFCRPIERTTSGALRATARGASLRSPAPTTTGRACARPLQHHRASLRSPAARRSPNVASPPCAQMAGAPHRRRNRRRPGVSGGRYRATPCAEHPPPTERLPVPHEGATTARRSSNAVAPSRRFGELRAAAFDRLRTDPCRLPRPWPWPPRQPSAPAAHPCPGTSGGCAP